MYFSLLDDYKKFENIMRKHKTDSKEIDASHKQFLAPTTLIPLLCEQKRRNIPIKLNEKTYSYVKKIIEGVHSLTNTPIKFYPIVQKKDKIKS